MAKSCLLDSRLFQTKRSGRINLSTTVNLPKELGITDREFHKNYGRYAGCVGLQVLKQEQDRGAMQEPILLIGGQPSKNPYGAKPTQVIRYIDRNIAEIGNVALMILQRLIMESPVGPFKPATRGDGTPNPHYYDCHVLLVNGRQWMPNDPPMKPTDTIQIVNTRIYAKRIEQGWSMQAPTGVYKKVNTWATRMFKNSFRIRWGYKALTGVPANTVRRYNFPKVKAGQPTALLMNSGRGGFGTGTYSGKADDNYNFVTNHAAAASQFGFKMVAAVFPYIELKPKTIAAGVGAQAGRSVSKRSVRF